MFRDETEALIDPADIADVAVRVLCEPGHAGRAYTLTGPQALTPAGQLNVIGDVIGREIKIDEPPPRIQRRRLHGRIPDADLDTALRPGRMPWAEPLPAVSDLLRRPPRTFRAWVVRHRGDFGHG
jgi:nucleoside-diphosphate-sugar epimerase